MFSEYVLHDLYNSDNAWNIVLLRYFNPVGHYKDIAPSKKAYYKSGNLMDNIIKVALKTYDHIDVYGSNYDTKDGTCIRDYIHIGDLSLGHISALKCIENNAGFKIYNLGTGVGYSVLDLINSFKEATGITIPYKLCERRNGDVPECYCSNEKANIELSWKPQKSILDMCNDSYISALNNFKNF